MAAPLLRYHLDADALTPVGSACWPERSWESFAVPVGTPTHDGV